MSPTGRPEGEYRSAQHEGSPVSSDALRVPPEQLGAGSGCRCEVVADGEALTRHFAATMVAEFRAAKDRARAQVVFIVPVGPIGQFELLAQHCNETRLSLADLVLINMDEYLTPGGDYVPLDDPLSFRAHMERALWSRLDPALAPPPAHRHFPDPRDPQATGRLIERCGGVDVAFGGVGITGHLAFNDPPEPGETVDEQSFANLPTRVVELNRETRTINAVTATRGNIDRIPRSAVTVGMKEILAATKIRLYLNRYWQCAIVRKMLHGPITAAVPASLVRRHPDVAVTMTAEVTQLPEPVLR
ncbi:MAG: glucosamine-6-phosphate isomerase [Betaproteobacteria bacterium]|nr:glucosamine-6-phosphate isomerase [Betaproteobacteria bacterium]